jgi:hypothetical protein
MPSRRTPRVHHGRRGRISPVAVLLFRDMESTECTCPPGGYECPGCRRHSDFRFMLHDVLGRKIWEDAFEYPEDEARDPGGVRMYHRLVAADDAQEPGEIELSDAQVHTLYEALREQPRTQADHARTIEAVIPHCLQPMDDVEFAQLLASAGLVRERSSTSDAHA